MKKMKKLLSIVMMLALVLSLGAQAFANTQVTIAGSEDRKGAMDAGSVYTAYKLMTAEYDRTEGGKDIYDYHINTKFLSAIIAGLDAVGINDYDAVKAPLTAQQEAAIIKAISDHASGDTRKFADAVFSKIAGLSLDKNTDYFEQTADPDNGNKVVFDLPDGYYLISEKVVENGENVATSQVMLDTAGHGNLEVKTKEEVPSSKKEVLDTNDSTDSQLPKPVAGDINDLDWGETADHDVGDTVYFRLTGTLPGDILTYDKNDPGYKLVFHDSEKNGLTLDLTTVKVYYQEKENGTLHELNDSEYDVTTSSKAHGDFNCTFEVTIGNVFDVDDITIAAGGQFVVVYGSVLDGENVVYGPGGNWNDMYLEYSNDHYSEGTGTTPPSTAVVFTYKMDTDKVDPDGKPLEGAGFTLLKKVNDVSELTKLGDTLTSLDEQFDKSFLDTHKMDSDKKYYIDVNGTYYRIVGSYNDVATQTNFEFKGIDDGDYVLVETRVPAGYNKAEDIHFTVEATHSVDGRKGKIELTIKMDGKVVSNADGVFEVTNEEGKIHNEVINRQGLELPETGGMGTTIFYTVGAILVVGAVILLVTRRRVSGASK